jgi:quercetin dioxygenase-like cupin family protein
MAHLHKDRSNYIEKKAWGEKHNIFYNHAIAVDRLHIRKGGYCSLHSHEFKYNRFYVETGKLLIRMAINNDIKNFIVGPGDECPYKIFDVPPGRIHQFQALEETICIEMAYAKVVENDIKRLNEGGITSGE